MKPVTYWLLNKLDFFFIKTRITVKLLQKRKYHCCNAFLINTMYILFEVLWNGLGQKQLVFSIILAVIGIISLYLVGFETKWAANRMVLKIVARFVIQNKLLTALGPMSFLYMSNETGRTFPCNKLIFDNLLLSNFYFLHSSPSL